MLRLPSFSSLWANYPHGEAEAVKSLIGGNVNASYITNTCVIRLCYALNRSGVRVSGSHSMVTVQGGDGYRYGLRVREFRDWMENKFGPPQEFGGGGQGIIMFDVHGWSDATGHFDLWDGAQCAHQGYFDRASATYLWPC